jgi:ribosome-binding protein aMBF1 (putative translation factor)
MSDPEILRPLESFSTKAACERREAILNRNELARLDELDRQNRQRAIVGGEMMRSVRLDRRWSQEELAERAGVPREVVGKMESGREWPWLDHEERLAKALGVDAKELKKYGSRFPTHMTYKSQCWPDTVDPRGTKP